MTTNIIKHDYSITMEDRNNLLGHKSPVIWLTGLSGSGKSTIANLLAKNLYDKQNLVYVLDGDNIRSGLNKDLGFSDEARKENIRRISEVAKLMSDAGVIVITAFISPFIEERQVAKNIIGDNFCEVFVDANLEVCESRDPKGLYKKARAGQIPSFTGIDSPYESPLNPDIKLNTADTKLEDCVQTIEDYMKQKLWTK